MATRDDILELIKPEVLRWINAVQTAGTGGGQEAEHDHAAYVRRDGTTTMLADWDAGAYLLRNDELQIDILAAIGVAPVTGTSLAIQHVHDPTVSIDYGLQIWEDDSSNADKYGIRIRTIDNAQDTAYGLYIDDVTPVDVSPLAAYAIYTNAGEVLFGDDTTLQADGSYLTLEPASDASAGTPDVDSPTLRFRAREWTGAASDEMVAEIQAIMGGNTPTTGYFSLAFDGTERFQIGWNYQQIQDDPTMRWISGSSKTLSETWTGIWYDADLINNAANTVFSIRNQDATYKAGFSVEGKALIGSASGTYPTTDAMLHVSTGPLGLDEQAAPSAPASGTFLVYPKVDGKIYGLNDAGTEYDLTAGVGVPTAAYSSITDGTNTASASGSDTFKLRTANTLLTILVTNNDVTHGDNALFTVNQANIDHGSISGLGDDDHAIYLLAGGTRALTGNWDAGSYQIRAQEFYADAAGIGIGASPPSDTGIAVAFNTDPVAATVYGVKVDDSGGAANANRYGFWVAALGSADSVYGLYIENVTGTLNQYAIYTNQGTVRFGDTVNVLADLYVDSFLSIAEQIAPGTPPSGEFYTYAKTDGKLYGKNDAGTEYDLTAGGSTAAGADTQVQFNDGGLFAGDSAFTWDKTNDRLTIGRLTVDNADLTQPVYIQNPANEDADGGRESGIAWRGYRSTGILDTLAAIVAEHQGTGTDGYGRLRIYTNDGTGTQLAFTIDKDGVAAFASSVTVAGTLDMASDLRHVGDTDTYLAFTSDKIDFYAGAAQMLTLLESLQDEVVVNEGGADVDFRVEASGITNALFVEGNTGRVGIWTTPTYPLHVVASATYPNAAYFAAASNGDGIRTYATGSGKAIDAQNSSTGIAVRGEGNSGYGGYFTSASGYALGTGTGGSIFNGTVDIADYLRHVGDTDTYLYFQTNRIDFYAEGVQMLTLLGTTQDEIIFNDASADIDFRVEASGVSSALFVEGNTGEIGIGWPSPEARLSIQADFTANNSIGLASRGTNSGGSMISIVQTGVRAWGIGMEAGATRLSFIDDRFPGNAGTERFSIAQAGDVAIGTITFPSAGGGKVIVFGDNGGNPTMGTNTAGIFAKDVSGTVEMFVVDEGSVATQISPHDPLTGEWVFYSKNLRTGRVTRVNMERLVCFLDQHFGTGFFEEWIETVE